MIFCRETEEEAGVLRQLLDLYAKASGQVINFEKYSMTFSTGVSPGRRNQIVATLGVNVVDCHDKYLGMPAVVGKSKKEVFRFLRERVSKRINGWGERTLSSVGNEVLIKAVLQSIPTYTMSCFLLPGYLISSIEAEIRSYWWGSGAYRKIAWVSWDKLCQAKTKGGLSFRNLRAFNLSLLAKQCWRIMEKPESLLAQVYRARYFQHGYFMEAGLGLRPSATWRSIIQARTYFEKCIRVRIGNGYDTAIWGSSWIPEDDNFRVITPPQISYFPNRVADVIDPVSGRWNEEVIRHPFWEIDHGRILSIPIGSTEAEDKMVWHYSRNGRFSVKSCYHLLSNIPAGHEGESSRGEEMVRWKVIWHIPIPPKIRAYFWRACRGILPHKAELYLRHNVDSTVCDRCGVEIEILMHVLLECHGVHEFCSEEPFFLHGFDHYGTMWALVQLLRKSLSADWFLVSLVVCWKIWDGRNKELHGDQHGFPPDVVAWVVAYLESYRAAQVTTVAGASPTAPTDWTAPEEGFIKINVDVGLPENINIFRTSMVA